MTYTELNQTSIKKLHQQIRQAIKEYEDTDWDAIPDEILEMDKIQQQLKKINQSVKDAWQEIAMTTIEDELPQK